jgi:hypothetical protein
MSMQAGRVGLCVCHLSYACTPAAQQRSQGGVCCVVGRSLGAGFALGSIGWGHKCTGYVKE